MIGKTVSHYRILEKLGEGGMGVVYKSLDTKLNRVVALKFLPASVGAEAGEVSRFLHEAQAISSLNHPHIATVHSLEEVGEQKFIVLEYLEGGTLKERIRQGQITIGEAIDWAMQMAEGLAYAHRREIVHRDIKTDNVMLTGEGRLKITDFGLAKLKGLSRITRTGSTIGTAGYMSPEQARGEDVDQRSDIFSLGVVLYEIIAGEIPFKGEHEAALIYEIVHEYPKALHEFRDDVPDALQRVVDKAMEKELGRRYQSVEEMLQDLRELKDTITSGATSSSPLVRTARRVLRGARRRSRWLVPLTGIVVVGLILLVNRVFSPAERISVAVLPFEISGERTEDNAAIAVGMAQSIVTKLTKLTSLRVTPWVTSQRYQGTPPEDLRAAASNLGVERLLTGTIRVVGDRVHVIVALIDSTASQQLWGDEMEEKASDIFAMQTKIAMGCAERLKGGLSGEEETLVAKPPAQRADAYEYYIKGSLKMQHGTQEDDNLALAFFDRAIELDPDLADAYVGRGAVYANQFFFGWGGKESLDEAIETYKRALEIDPQSAGARRGLVWEYNELFLFDGALQQGAAVQADQVGEIEALSVKADAYFAGGLPDKAVPIYDRILQLDRQNRSAMWHLVIALTWSIQPEQALDAGEAYLERFGEDPEIYTWMAYAYQQLGDLNAARLHCERAMTLFGGSSNFYVDTYCAQIHLLLGDSVSAISLLLDLATRLEERVRGYPSNFRMVTLLIETYAVLGKFDNALKFLPEPGQNPTIMPVTFPTIERFAKHGSTKIIQRILGEFPATHADLLFQVNQSRSVGAITEIGLAELEKAGFLSRQAALDAKLRAIY